MSIRITLAGWCTLVCLLASGCVGWQFQPRSGPSRWSQRTGESPVDAWPGETPAARAELNARDTSQARSTAVAARHSLQESAATQPGNRDTAMLSPHGASTQVRQGDRSAVGTVVGQAAADGYPMGSPVASGSTRGGSPASSLSSSTGSSGDRSQLQITGSDGTVSKDPQAELDMTNLLPSVEAGRLITSVSGEGQVTNRSPVYGSVTDQVAPAAGPGAGITAPPQAAVTSRLASAFVTDEAAPAAPLPANSSQPSVVADGEQRNRMDDAEGEGAGTTTGTDSEPAPAPEAASTPAVGATVSPDPARADATPPASSPQANTGSRDATGSSASTPLSGSSNQTLSPLKTAQANKVGVAPAPSSFRPNSLRPDDPSGHGQMETEQSGRDPVSSQQPSPGQANPAQPGVSQAASGQASANQFGAGQSGPGQSGPGQAGGNPAGAGQIGLAQAGFGTPVTGGMGGMGGMFGGQPVAGPGQLGPAVTAQPVPGRTTGNENPLGLPPNSMPAATGQGIAGPTTTGSTTTGPTSLPQAVPGKAEIGLFTPIPGLSPPGNSQAGSGPASVNPTVPFAAPIGPATSASAAAFPGGAGQAASGQTAWGGPMTGPAPAGQPGNRPQGSGSFVSGPTGPGRYGVWPAPGQATNGLGLGIGPAVGTGIGGVGRGEPAWNGPANGPANAANRPGQRMGEVPPRRVSPATPEIEPLSAPVPPSIPLGVTRGQDAGWSNVRQPGLPAQQLPPPPASGQPLQTLDGQPLFVNPYPIDPPPSALPYETGQPLPPPLDFDVYVDETRTGRFMFGAGVNSDLGVTGQIVVEERNFDWRAFPTSFSDIVNGTAWRGAGQGFRFEAMPGTQVQRYLVSFTQPYLYLPGIPDPLSLNLSGSYFNRNFFDWDEERLGGRVGLGYRLTHDLSLTTSFRAENVKIYNPRVLGNPQLDEVLGNNDIFSGRVGLTHDTRDQPFSPTEGHLIELSYEQAFGSFDYPRGELDFRQYFLMRERPDGSGRHTLGFSFRASASGSQTPIMERFFAGGFSTLRGFDFRGASPVGVGGVVVGGDFSFLGSVEYMFPLTADDMMRGVVFCDFGTVEESIEFRSENYRVAPGAGLRIAVPALGPAPLALDFAFPVAKAETDQEQIFSFFFGFGR